MFEKLFDYMTTTDLPNWIIVPVIIIIAILSSPVGVKLLKLLYQQKKTNKKLSRDYLINHSFFDFMDYSINQRIKALYFGSTFKNNVFKDMLITEYDGYRKAIYNWVMQSVSITSPYSFKNLIKELLDKTILNIQHDWEKLEIPRFESIEQEFLSWQMQSYHFTTTSILKTVNSKIYDNNCERIEAILLIFQTYFEITLIDIENGLREINGKYKNEKYKSRLIK